MYTKHTHVHQTHQAPTVPHTLKQETGACSIDVWLLEPDSAMHTHCATLTLHTLV